MSGLLAIAAALVLVLVTAPMTTQAEGPSLAETLAWMDNTFNPHEHSSGHGHGSLTKLAVGAIGIVFGDIGTSPIYAFRETFAGHHTLHVDQMHIYKAPMVVHKHPVEIVIYAESCEPECVHEIRVGLVIGSRDGDVEVIVLARLVSEQSVDSPTSI